MGNYIDKITGKDASGNTVDAQIMHSYLNDSGNMEISNVPISGAASDSKVNIVSKSDIQIKPGDDGTIQLDCENNTTTGNPTEVSIKICNGEYNKNTRVVSTKVNVAEITIDNQKAHTSQVSGDEDVFDIDKIKVNFRTDKWKNKTDDTPTRKNNTGPVDVKLRAKSFDIRCHGNQPGGGIALQPCGSDPQGFENKIKFESSRTAPINTDASGVTYDTEGGQGLEFGTFNNLHTSLFTEDYRFNKDGIVYAVTREEPVFDNESGKYDYPTQQDDFKDVIDNKKCASWINIVSAGKESTTVISKSGKPNPHKGMIVNNMHIPVYIDKDGVNLYLCEDDLDTVYDASGNLIVFGTGWTEDVVYVDAEHTTPVEPSSKLFLKDEFNLYWIADIKSNSKLRSYDDDKNDKVVNMSVVQESGLPSGNVKIVENGGLYNADENPIVNALKKVITSVSVTGYTEFVDAMKQTFGWS